MVEHLSLTLALAATAAFFWLAVSAVRAARRFRKATTWRFVSVEPSSEHDVTITVRNDLGEQVSYRGDCTVWHRVPDGKRADTSTEEMLCDMWTAEWEWKDKE